MAYLDESGLSRLWTHIMTKLGGKVDKEEGKGLSSNDFTTAEKEKLAGLNSVTVDSYLSSTSTNPVENKAIYNALNGAKNILLLKDSYGDTFNLEIKDDTLTTTKNFSRFVFDWNSPKTTYTVGENFDPTGSSCLGHFIHGTPVDLTNELKYLFYRNKNYSNEIIDSSYVFKKSEVGEHKIVLNYGTRRGGGAYITIIDPPIESVWSVYFDNTEEDDIRNYEGSLDSLEYFTPGKDYKAIFEFENENIETSLNCVRYMFNGETESYRFETGAVDHPDGGTLSATIDYYDTTGETYVSFYYSLDDGYEGENPPSNSLVGKLHIVEIETTNNILLDTSYFNYTSNQEDRYVESNLDSSLFDENKGYIMHASLYYYDEPRETQTAIVSDSSYDEETNTYKFKATFKEPIFNNDVYFTIIHDENENVTKPHLRLTYNSSDYGIAQTGYVKIEKVFCKTIEY